jgi:hypothetical protein
MEVAGYCVVKNTADFSMAMPDDKSTWADKPLRAVEINENTGSVLVISPCGTGMAMFDTDSLKSYFHSTEVGDVLVPPNLDLIERMIYHGLVISRNGGYSPILKQMVIMQSLHKGEFDDSVLWAKGQSEEILKMVNGLKNK